MDVDKHTQSVVLQCSTCGNDQFSAESVDTDVAMVTCAGCGRTMTKDELIAENGENIEANVDDMVQDVVQDIAKDMRLALQNAFRGSKNIKIR